jgi:hypothetical protein
MIVAHIVKAINQTKYRQRDKATRWQTWSFSCQNRQAE